MSTRLSIDPGVQTGWALWSSDWKLLSHGIIKAPNKVKEFDTRINIIGLELRAICRNNFVKQVYMEYPAFFGSTAGRMVAGRGDLVKLTYMAGALQGYLNSMGLWVERIEVNRWKGSLPKDVVIKRIQKILPNCKATSHDADAIGIGLYAAGKF